MCLQHHKFAVMHLGFLGKRTCSTKQIAFVFGVFSPRVNTAGYQMLQILASFYSSFSSLVSCNALAVCSFQSYQWPFMIGAPNLAVALLSSV